MIRSVWPWIAVAVTALAQFHVTRAFFWSDDFLNLYQLRNDDVLQFVLRMHGGHLLITRNVVFLLFSLVFGTNAAGYFWGTFLTHLLNVFLLFQTIRALTDIAKLGCFGAALWGTLPMNEGALTWYSVYGEVLAATFLVSVLAGLAGAGAGCGARRVGAALWAAQLLAASTCFGVGLGVTLLMPAIAFLLLPRSGLRRRTVVAFILVAVAVPVLYVATQRLYVRLSGEAPPSAMLIAGLSYWRQHAQLFRDLLGFAITAVLVGPFALPQLAGTAYGYALVGLYALGLLCVLVRAPGRVRRTVLALLLFAAAVYGIIAAGRGMFRTAANAAWMASTPRFHYVGSIPLVAALCLVLAQLGERVRPRARVTTLLLAGWIAVSVAVSARAFLTKTPDSGLANRTETALAIAEMRTAIDSTPPGGDVYIPNRPFRGVGPLVVGAPAVFPGWAALFTIYFPANTVDGRRVFFIEHDPAAIAAAERGRRSAGLLAPADATPHVPDGG